MTEIEEPAVTETDDCGCDEGATVAAGAVAQVDMDPRGTKVTRWSGLLAPYEKATGDKRTFAQDSLTHRPLPFGLKWQRRDEKGHEGSTAVGTVDMIDYREDGVYGAGILFDPDPDTMPRLAEDVAEVRLLMDKKVIGPSVDLGRMEIEPVDPAAFASATVRPDIRVLDGEIAAVTLVPVPAFTEARPFALDEVDAEEYAALTASARAEVPVRRDWSDVPVGFVEWSPLEWLEREAEGDPLVASTALYHGDAGNLFPVGTPLLGQVHVIPGAVADAISVFTQYGDQLPLSVEEAGVMRSVLVDLAERCDLPAPPWAVQEEEALVASGNLAAPIAPPAEWFDVPEADKPTPLTVTPDGRVYGHIADWKTCHTGLPNSCTTAPRSASGYAYFHTGEVHTQDGRALPVGRITVGGGHADTRYGLRAAVAHYDDASTTAAIVRAKDGKHGIWVSGAAVPEATPQQLAQLRRHPPSGDWRGVGGMREMILAHSVNAPGFPIARAHVADGKVVSLVAAGALHPEDERLDDEDTLDARALEAADVFTAGAANLAAIRAATVFTSR